MKVRNSLKRTFTAALAGVQVLALLMLGCLIGPAAAAEDAEEELPTYTLYRTDGVTLDGGTEGDEWDLVPWSSDFSQFYSNTNETPLPVFGAKFKAMWNYTGGQGYIYLLIDVYDPTTESSANWTKDGFIFAIDETGDPATAAIASESETSTCRRTATMGTRALNTSKVLEYTVAYNETGYVVEAIYKFVDSSFAKAGQVRMDVVAQNECAGSTVMQYSWSGVNYGSDGNFNPKVGIGILSEQTAAGQAQGGELDPEADVLFLVGEELVASRDAVNGTVTLPEWDTRTAFVGWLDESGEKLYPAGYVCTVGSEQMVFTAATLELYLQAGAAVLVEEPTAIRFTAGYDPESFAALESFVTGQGGLIAKADDLTDAVLEDGSITAEELEAAGIAFDDVTPELDEAAGLLRLVKQEVADTAAVYAASAYITVRYSDEDGTERSFYTAYAAEDNARSVAQVAAAAFADRSNVGVETGGVNYAFRVDKEFAVGDFVSFSYSPYTAAQLTLLKQFAGS